MLANTYVQMKLADTELKLLQKEAERRACLQEAMQTRYGAGERRFFRLPGPRLDRLAQALRPVRAAFRSTSSSSA